MGLCFSFCLAETPSFERNFIRQKLNPSFLYFGVKFRFLSGPKLYKNNSLFCKKHLEIQK